MAKPGGDTQGGMEPSELKRMLRLASSAPVQAAFAIGGDGRPIIMMDKRKPPRALEKELKESAPDAKSHRYGTVSVDPDDPKLARFVVNKAASGMAGKLVKALKGTGFSKIKILLEDGTELEAHEDTAPGDDDGNVGHDPGPPDGRSTEGDGPVSVDPDDGGPGVPEHGAAGLEMAATYGAGREASEKEAAGKNGPAKDGSAKDGALQATKALSGLVQRMLGVMKNDPSQRGMLAELAKDAQASIRRGDLDEAAASMEVLRMALDDIAPPPGGPADGKPGTGGNRTGQPPDGPPGQGAGAKPAGTKIAPSHPAEPGSGTPGAEGHGTGRPPPPAKVPDAPGSHGAAHPATPVILKAAGAWTAARQRIERDIATLSKQFEFAFTDHEMADELVTAFKARVEEVLHHLDDALTHKLDEVSKANDAAHRVKAVDEAHKLIARYSQHIASDATIREIDANPFVPMALAKTLTATLSTLSKSIR